MDDTESVTAGPTSDQQRRLLARRTFMQRLLAITGGTAAGMLLEACGSTATAPAASSAAGAASPSAAAASAATVSAAASPSSAASAEASTEASAAASTEASSAAASVAGDSATPAIVAAANAFLATLSDTERESVLFDWTDTEQKQRWSNLPEGLYERAGLMWGDISEEQQNAWLALMQATLSEEGYNRVQAEWSADDALAASEGSGGASPAADASPAGNASPAGDASPAASGEPPSGSGGPPDASGGGPPSGGGGGPGGQLLYGREYYWVALIGTPSETDPWQWQWGGHHVTINATIVGANLALTPSFIGVQPGTYTDSSGNTVRPLGDINDEAFALVNSLDPTQQQSAVLGDTSIDLVLGPGQDGTTIEAEGLPASEMTAEQQAAFLQLIGHYTGLANDAAAAARLTEIESTLDETYFAWYGPTTEGSGAYFRVTGPTIVIEYSAQGAGGTGTGLGGEASLDHIHGIYRDPTNDYGAKYTA